MKHLIINSLLDIAASISARSEDIIKWINDNAMTGTYTAVLLEVQAAVLAIIAEIFIAIAQGVNRL